MASEIISDHFSNAKNCYEQINTRTVIWVVGVLECNVCYKLRESITMLKVAKFCSRLNKALKVKMNQSKIAA